MRLPRRRPSIATPVRGRPVLRSHESSSSSRSAGSITSPDRFLPSRRPALNASTESFRINKDVNNLTTEEKLLRHSGASHDAFNPRRRITAPVPSAINPPQRISSASRHGGTAFTMPFIPSLTLPGASILTFQRDPSSSAGQRQVRIELHAGPGRVIDMCTDFIRSVLVPYGLLEE
jgi:meiosis-specific APC/C activator protein AMA1